MKLVYANTTTTVTLENGMHVLIRWGEHWPASDPVVKAHPGLFGEDPTPGLRVSAPLAEEQDGGEPPVEQTTAAPGEKRSTRRGTK